MAPRGSHYADNIIIRVEFSPHKTNGMEFYSIRRVRLLKLCLDNFFTLTAAREGLNISCSTPSFAYMNATDFLLRDRAKGVLICGTQYVGVGRCNNSWPPPPPNGALCKINDRGVVCFEGDKLGSADSAYIRKLTLPRGVINLLASERERARASGPSLCAAENNVRGANKNVCSPAK
jgi:hypothetical protein